MGELPIAKNHRELIVWQLCHQIRLVLIRTLRNRRSEIRFTSQIRASIRSACNNVVEGFYGKRDRAFVNYLIISLTSLAEFEDQLDEGFEDGTFTEAPYRQMKRLTIRAQKANGGLRRYLLKSIAKRERNEARHRRTSARAQ